MPTNAQSPVSDIKPAPFTAFNEIPTSLARYKLSDFLSFEDITRNLSLVDNRSNTLFSGLYTSRLLKMGVHPDVLKHIPQESRKKMLYRLEELKRNAPNRFDNACNKFLRLGMLCPGSYYQTLDAIPCSPLPSFESHAFGRLFMEAAYCNNVELVQNILLLPKNEEVQFRIGGIAFLMALTNGNLKLAQWVTNQYSRRFQQGDEILEYLQQDKNPDMDIVNWLLNSYYPEIHQCGHEFSAQMLLGVALSNCPQLYCKLKQFIQLNSGFFMI